MNLCFSNSMLLTAKQKIFNISNKILQIYYFDYFSSKIMSSFQLKDFSSISFFVFLNVYFCIEFDFTELRLKIRVVWEGIFSF